MSLQIYLGVRLPEKPYERVLIKAVTASKTVLDLKLEAEQLLKHSNKELEFIYRGVVLEDHQILEEQRIATGSTIHVFQKDPEETPRDLTVAEADIEATVYGYRPLFLRHNGFAKMIRPEVIKKILDEYPEFYKELGAFAIIKDPILLGRIITFEYARKMAESYPILIISSKFVIKTMKAYMKTVAAVAPTNATATPEESFSDESSTSEGDSPAASPNRSTDIRRISRGQLATALMLAGSSSLNSLSNIANIGEQPIANTNELLPAVPNTDSSPAIAPSTSTTSLSNRISNSVFSSALSQAFDAVAPTTLPRDMSNLTNQIQPTGDGNPQRRFTSELYTMREIGLMDESSNLQALILCNGNVEAAINLVLAGMSGFAG